MIFVCRKLRRLCLVKIYKMTVGWRDVSYTWVILGTEKVQKSALTQIVKHLPLLDISCSQQSKTHCLSG